MSKIKVRFEGIDGSNLPIFKEVGKKHRYGSVDILFSYMDTTEKDVKAKVSEKDLTYFGNSFGCEPMGTACDVEIEWGDTPDPEQILSTLLQGNHKEGHYPKPYVSDYFKAADKWIAFDNKTRCCWVEEFDTEREAIAFCNGDI